MPADIKDRILKIGKESGCISINMLNDLIPEEKDANYIDGIFSFLEKNEIEVASHEDFGKKKKEKPARLRLLFRSDADPKTGALSG